MLLARGEGFGVAFAEAMSAQVPVVASRIAPLDEIVEDGARDVPADCDGPAAFVRLVGPLLMQPELCQGIGRVGHRRVFT